MASTAQNAELRRLMVLSLQARGIRDPSVARAMGQVPREAFVAPDLECFAYEDRPLPIGFEQTASQPYVVALMAQALRLAPTDRVLEVGTGCGYAAAVLSRLTVRVESLERNPELAAMARARLEALGYSNVSISVLDGTLGLPRFAPYDGIIVAAAGPLVPEALVRQLALGGRLVIPVGDEQEQRLTRVTRHREGLQTEDLGGVRFVPLIGAQGWPEGPAGDGIVGSGPKQR